MPSRFDGQVVLVTGAAQGIGRSLSLGFARQGADVAMIDIKRMKLDAVAHEIQVLGQRVFPLELDLRDAAAIAPAVERNFGPIDVLVNNDGVVQTKPMMELIIEDWDRVLEINLKGLFFMSQAVALYMLSRKQGSIVNFSSVAGRSGRPLSAHYAASKAGLISLTKSAALALAPRVRVNAVCPGYVPTPMQEQIEPGRSSITGKRIGHWSRELTQLIPLKRAALLEEIVSAVQFLASPESSYITG